ncbi:proteasome activator complex subunit 3 [Lingula anatina]|uniref:Proteasome activator complex subunit 3 n=1 Tax=Lingula anatina TaxID=7574 RepID=A0A1S3GYF5_LINAN|nr:proteasome activator complex subunit 3-like [Lingula anatina]XP_013379567.1 proteasome activator complex subunit 3 [Lingula anatina]|eukprot:XP_013378905.1 proteasome activator complex subunit 3-like [Lingula anatina]
MAQAVNDKVKDFKEKCKKEAEHIVLEVFPEKVKELDDLLHSDMFSLKRISSIHHDVNIPVPDPALFNDTEEPTSKKRRIDSEKNHLDISGSLIVGLPNGVSPSNPKICEIIEKLKPSIMELLESSNQVKMWITYLIPRIEDGNNFGVSIQEDTLAEARQVESETATFLDQMTRYFIHRGKLISKVAKYPHVADYRQSIRELDEKEFITLRLVCCELRNQYATLHDIIIKNINKIRIPRSSNVEQLY